MTREIAGQLYNPQHEHDACGVGFVAHIHGQASHAIVQQGLSALANLQHRGGSGSDPRSGDGAGILLQMPHAFLHHALQGALPPAGQYGAGLVFLPHAPQIQDAIVGLAQTAAADAGLHVLAWREVPVDLQAIGSTAAACAPVCKQVVVAGQSGPALERALYRMRRLWEKAVDGLGSAAAAFYVVSLSGRTLVYKGMLQAEQVARFYVDLQDARLVSALALVHQRFSTNTLPSWALAHPYRYVAHNGEINTLRGNINWMRARQAVCGAEDAGVAALLPVVREGGSDTATFDNVLEFLVAHGRSLPHAMLMMIPEPWAQNREMPAARRDFYAYHASLMEPWDGPAAVCFTDGQMIGAVLDRNGLRPSRYVVTHDNRVIMASEMGVLDIAPDNIKISERLRPGKIFLVDTAAGRIVGDDAIKDQLAQAAPYGAWLRTHAVPLSSLPTRPERRLGPATCARYQRVFGYTLEDQRFVLDPMGQGDEAMGSMGIDTPLAVLSERPRLLYDYFKQLFAQVTNPPIDALREALITDMESTLGAEENLLRPTPLACRQIKIPAPVLNNEELSRLVDLQAPGFTSTVLPGHFAAHGAAPGEDLEGAVQALQKAAEAAVQRGVNLLVLTDRGVTRRAAPIPSLLATAAVHQHLVRVGLRTRTALVVESCEAREVHHVALLLSYGAGAVSPALACALQPSPAKIRGYLQALTKGLLKIMSKMGISTLQGYCGAQIFEALGLSQNLLNTYFSGTHSGLGGVDLDVLAREVHGRHRNAYPAPGRPLAALNVGGEVQWRRDGEPHLFNPTTVQKLQHATRSGQYALFKEYSEAVNAQGERAAVLRNLLQLRWAATPLPLQEVESADSIITRFATGAMSYGSISAEAHETLAVAMNRMGARSNCGEGGEDVRRFEPDANGDWRRSAIKQVASGRFGVTSHYLVNATDLQIKMAQGAKPGEGGQLPGHKVLPWIASVRHATPGVGLISPPPHHDIYSIEDLAQLIFDLKNANPLARVHVKLVAEGGVGTIAAGVAKAMADVVLISGYDGGTGAAPLTSIKHAGVPWEIGLAETQQVLLQNNLRDRMVVQVDGHMKTGRDVVLAALLGAEEFGFATAPLIVSGCVMMRVCHLNTCPVGIATQDPQLRERFTGKPEFVENFFRFIAEEVRELMARLGVRRLTDLVGRTELLQSVPTQHWKARHLRTDALLHVPEHRTARHCTRAQAHKLEKTLDALLLPLCAPAILRGEPMHLAVRVGNGDRAIGTRLGNAVTVQHGAAGLPHHTLRLDLWGIAGQSLGAFMPSGITLSLQGSANDAVGKGLCGGKIVVMPPPNASYAQQDDDSVAVGNVALYGATAGELFVRGVAAERFAVRNSGAWAVVEGVGDHGCEYMTGGGVLVLGSVGRNFAAGMSGGVAYVYDADGVLPVRCNPQMVDLEALEADDLRLVQGLLSRHQSLTGSPRAARILASWSSLQQDWVKVMPKDLKRVLAASAAAPAAAPISWAPTRDQEVAHG